MEWNGAALGGVVKLKIMILKIIISLFTWMFILSNTVVLSQSAEPRSEMYISYGFYSVPRLTKELGKAIIPVLASPYTDINHIQVSGNQVFVSGYNYQFNSKYKIGGHFLYENFSQITTFPDGEYYQYNTNIYTLLGRFYRNWTNKDNSILEFYTSLSIGISFFSYSDQPKLNHSFAFQLTPIGLRSC